MVKNIYVRPNDLINIHVISDEEETCNKEGFYNQLSSRQEVIQVVVVGIDSINVITPNHVYGGRQCGKLTNK